MQNQDAARIRWAVIALAGTFLALAPVRCYSAPANTRHAKSVRNSDAQINFESITGDDASLIRYVARAGSYDLYISREEADVVLHGGLQQSGEAERGKVIVVHAYANVLRMRFVHANPPTSVEPAGGRNGNSFGAVTYRGIYSGADVIVRANRGRLGFQLDLCPGADTKNAVLEIGGATSIGLDSRGNAVVHAGREAIVLQRPLVRMQSNGRAQTSLGAYQIEGADRLRFIVSGNLPQSRVTMTD